MGDHTEDHTMGDQRRASPGPDRDGRFAADRQRELA
jgi:hypothetical protein